MILALQTTTFGSRGGIPTYNRVVSRALNEFDYPREKRLLVATDSQTLLSSHQTELPDLVLKGFSGRRTAFVSHILWLAFTERIDLVLIGHVNYAPLGSLLRHLQPRLSYGVIMYGIDAWRPLTGLRLHALQHANFLISISEHTKQEAVRINALEENRILLLPNAVDGSVNDQRTSATRSERVPGTRLLSVCRLDQDERYKGVDTVIEALPEIIEKVPGLHYTVVGGGSDLKRHIDLAERLGVRDRVTFRGFVNEETLQACYQDCDIFVMPSAGEGFGFVFLEAMKYGKVVVAAKSGGTPEVVQDGITGRLVQYGNKAHLAETVIDLCLNPDERRSLGDAGYQRLQQRFTFPRFKQQLTEILRKQLASNSGIGAIASPQITG